MKNRSIHLLIAALLLVASIPARGFVPLTGRGEADNSPARVGQERQPLPMSSWLDFIDRYGSDWKIDWAVDTGTPRAIYGSNIDVYPGRIPDASALSARLLSFVDENEDLLGVKSSELEPVNSMLRGRLWHATYQQTADGVPIYGGHLQFRLTRDGKLVAITGRIHRETGILTSPALSAERASERARSAVSFVEGRDLDLGSELVVYPLYRESGTRYILSYLTELITREPAGHWFTVIDAVNGTIVDQWNQIYYDESNPDSIYGRAGGSILPETPTDTLEARLFKDLLVELTGGGSDVTDPGGHYAIESVDPDSVLAELRGPFVDVDNQEDDDAVIRLQGLFGEPVNIPWDDDNSVVAERNGFYHTVVVHDYIKNLDSTFTGLDYIVPCRVNLNQTCNAFWDGFATNFFRAGDGCANTANIADVIYHEYGHGVTDFQYRPFPQPSGAMHEGFSDYIAATITNQSLIGRGFFGPGTSIRDTENDRVWPADECGGEPHCVGEAIAGALWDMRQNLILSLGETAGVALADTLWHYARYGLSTTFPDYLIDVLVVDDDDGDLFNGVPHAEEICDGFQNHGVPCVLTPNAPIIYDVGNGTDLQLAWQPVPSLLAPVADYWIFYGTESEIYTDSLASGGDTTAVVSGLSEGEVYYFALMSQDSTGLRSNLSPENSGAPNSLPQPPSGLTARSDRESVFLSWMPNSELDLAGYAVERSTSVDTGFTEIAEVSHPDTSYVDADIEAGPMYFYRVAARDADLMTGDPSEPVRARLMSLDSGILVIDGTKDGQDGIPFSWADSTVDNFYGRLLDDYAYSAEYDIADSVGVALFSLDQATMAPYTTVVWHQDDRQSLQMTPYLDELAKYLSEGGNLLLSGWYLSKYMSDVTAGVVDFPPGSVPHDFLKMDSTEVLQTAVQDFVGADAQVEDYPDLTVDAEKAFLLGGNLFNGEVVFDPLVGEPLSEPIYTYRSSEGDTAAYHGFTVGYRYSGDDYHLIVFDFPLFYMLEPSAREAFAQAMSDLGEAVGIEDEGEQGGSLPRAFALSQNYPNPFNPSTSIVVDVPVNEDSAEGTRTRVTIHDMRGRLVSVLLDGVKEPGRYVLHWDGRNDRGERVSSGVYFYRMKAGDFTETRKMLLLE